LYTVYGIIELINTDLGNIFRANYAKWVTEGTVDADWNDYLANVKNAGLDNALQIMQKYYDAYKAANK
jgi:putative aldouronate transport system substrate-binding protein